MTITEIAKRVAQTMIATVDANRRDYLETEDFESLFETCFDKDIEGMTLKGDAYTYVYQWVIKHSEIEAAFDACKELRDNAREAAADDILYHQSPMKYYGLKNSDFL